MSDARYYLAVIVLQISHVCAVVIVGLRLVFYALDSRRKVTVVGVCRDVIDQLMQYLRNKRLRVELLVLYEPDAGPKIYESSYFLAADKRGRAVYISRVHDLLGCFLVFGLAKIVVQKYIRQAIVNNLSRNVVLQRL